MRLGLLGAGMQGVACVYDWLRQDGVEEIRVLDSDETKLATLQMRFEDRRIRVEPLDVSRQEHLPRAIHGLDAVASMVPYYLNVAVTKAAIEARVPMVDLGGNVDVVQQQRALDPEARRAGITILPDQGLAPGLAGILGVYGMRGMDSVEEVRLRVGGLPQQPEGPLGYALSFSIHGLLNEYSGEAVGLEDGRISRQPALGGVEKISFPPPLGDCEAAYTSGGTSTLPWTLEGRVRDLDYKTIRYPGHWEHLGFLKEIGMLDTQAVRVGRLQVSPREMLATLLEPLLEIPGMRDLVVLRVSVRGSRGGEQVRRQYDMLDFHDEESGLSAMTRCTSFPASESALLLARGALRESGVLAAEEALPMDAYVEALRRRGLRIEES